ncbi:hypothetical protein MKW98_004186 [Papaver atlanticum]|uniref:Uncharacterized protein n=1 Tax=Papaver atlanticum TaxID=357466 RepID=A0AAD4T695_9MAGN|nr:hypothetical protein MKW98_004186 [Papaver atlanticum]
MAGVGSAIEINVDSSGWTLVTGKESSSLKGKNRVVVNSKSLCEVEPKVFSIEIGYGMKKGLFLIREQKGSYSSSLWVSSNALAWILSKFTEETSKSWSGAAHWHFLESSEWLVLSRGKNKAGEFLKLMGPNKNGGNIDLFFPSGKYGVGWSKWVKYIENIYSPPPSVIYNEVPFSKDTSQTVNADTNGAALLPELTDVIKEMRCGYQFLVFLSFYGIPELMNHWVLNVGE